MLQIEIRGDEYWDEAREEFIIADKPRTILLEHSLVSVAKWEAKWHKAFINRKEKTTEELVDYIRCMTITQNVDPKIYSRLSVQNFQDVLAYLEEPMTATYISGFNGKESHGGGDKITSELIYYWMISYNIPMECQKWHLNRLLTLIKVFNAKSSDGSKRTMSNKALLSHRAALNKARQKRLHTKG